MMFLTLLGGAGEIIQPICVLDMFVLIQFRMRGSFCHPGSAFYDRASLNSFGEHMILAELQKVIIPNSNFVIGRFLDWREVSLIKRILLCKFLYWSLHSRDGS